MRNPEKPIGKITANGYGVARAAGAIHYALHFQGPQSVFVCEQGRVYALPRGTAIAEAWCSKHSEWWIGDYTLGAAYRASVRADQLRGDIESDLRDRAVELKAMAA